jgi:hypothetical protein
MEPSPTTLIRPTVPKRPVSISSRSRYGAGFQAVQSGSGIDLARDDSRRESQVRPREIPGGVKIVESAEAPKFSGLAIASLYSHPQLMSKSGSVVIAAEAALEYGFKDFNRKQPPSLREQKGSPRPFFTKS